LGIIPDHFVILGAGYVGLEFAQAMKRLGSRVTLIDRGERVLKQEDPDVSEAVLDLLRDEDIELLLEATVASVSGESGKQVSLTIDQSGRQVTLNATHILVTTTRTPNTDGLGLDAAGVETNGRDTSGSTNTFRRPPPASGQRAMLPEPQSLLTQPSTTFRYSRTTSPAATRVPKED
jgi:pyruvate/2-oxoglutarate dehydrogenase complex dihydrolipoamide dehydrogenase (E3) component